MKSSHKFKYSGKINYLKAKEWGLTPNLCILFDWMYGVPSWSTDTIIVDNMIFYFASKNKAISDLVILTDKIDTMYRYYKQLEDKGLIILNKIGNKDYIRLTEKGKHWDIYEVVGEKKNETEGSEINPTLGNKSDEPRKTIRDSSEINPTNNTISNNILLDKEKELRAHEFFKEKFPSQFEILEMRYKKRFSKEDWEDVLILCSNKIVGEELKWEPRILMSRFENFIINWIRKDKLNKNQKQKPKLPYTPIAFDTNRP